MASDGAVPEPPRLSQTEARVLQLYDNLQQLQLELALLRAQLDTRVPSGSSTSTGSPDQLLEAKALLSLRNNVLEGVMMVQPLLEAVHDGTKASPVEKDLAPRVEQRDLTATRAARQSSDLNSVTEQLVKVQLEVQTATKENVLLASNVLQLAEEIRARHHVQDVEDIRLKKALAEVEKDLVASRQRWKAIKGVTSAIVAGSGVDWARDNRLRDMVLDPPD
ncbi:Centromere protein H (CENP-H) domain containing protein [Naviculisporaceae sp. PSN 640]